MCLSSVLVLILGSVGMRILNLLFLTWNTRLLVVRIVALVCVKVTRRLLFVRRLR